MNDKFPYLRRIAPQEFADFLNAKGSNAGAFKCPVCGEEHQQPALTGKNFPKPANSGLFYCYFTPKYTKSIMLFSSMTSGDCHTLISVT